MIVIIIIVTTINNNNKKNKKNNNKMNNGSKSVAGKQIQLYFVVCADNTSLKSKLIYIKIEMKNQREKGRN